jgi:hypothetical protein
MAKNSGSRGTQHSLHGGLRSHAVDGAGDSSRKISSKKSVNDEAVRTGVAVGEDGNKRKDSGSLK